MAEQVYQSVQRVLTHRRERLMGNGAGPGSGQLAHDLDGALAKISGPVTSNNVLGLLLMMPQGTRAGFDKKTHRRILQRTTRLTYLYLAARLLEKRPEESITEEVLAHLQSAQQTIRRAWGANEFARLPDLEPGLRDTLCEQLGEETCAQLQTQPLQSLDREQVIRVMDEFGRRMLTEVYRQLLLGVITELWVDYLTQMEALRVSIGLEAYGQRDPLVEYKREAFDKFQNLLKDMRAGVISRMFIYRPRDMSAMQTEVRRPTPEEAGVGLQPTLEIAEATGDDGNEPAAGSPADGSEEQEQAEELEMEAQPDQPNLSRSQKRRRHRK
jgi:preprotein translocase subunit SecA